MLICHRDINCFCLLCSIYGYVFGAMKCTVTATCITSLSAQMTPLRGALECESKTPEDSSGTNIVYLGSISRFVLGLLSNNNTIFSGSFLDLTIHHDERGSRMRNTNQC